MDQPSTGFNVASQPNFSDKEAANSSLIGPDTQLIVDELCDDSRFNELMPTKNLVQSYPTTFLHSNLAHQYSQIKECVIRLEKRDLVSEPATPLEPVFTPPPFKDYSKVKIIRRIPKAARFNAAKELTRRVANIVSQNDMVSWFNLFSFATCCLCRSIKKCKNDKGTAY